MRPYGSSTRTYNFFLKILCIHVREQERAWAGDGETEQTPAEQGARHGARSQDPEITIGAKGRCSITEPTQESHPKTYFMSLVGFLASRVPCLLFLHILLHSGGQYISSFLREDLEEVNILKMGTSENVLILPICLIYSFPLISYTI